MAAFGILVCGAMATINLSRETFPETSVDYVLVTVAYPGANPEDVEEAALVKIEQVVEGIPGLKEIVSFSKQDSGQVFIAFDPSVTPTMEVLRQVQDRVNSITTFPDDMERPIVTEQLVRNSVINLGVHGQVPERIIKQVVEDFRRQLLATPGISQVSLSGVRDFEISVQLSEVTLERYGITLQQVIDAIRQSSLDVPAGVVRTRSEEISVRTIGQRYTARDFEDLVVIARPDGTLICLGQIAKVRDSFDETPIFGRINGEAGAMISVFKTGREDISTIARTVRGFAAKAAAQLPAGIKLSTWGDASRDVDSRLEMLVKNALMGMGLVVVCLLMFMDLPSVIAVAVGIPVAFAGAFAVIGFTGQSLNMISLLALLMAVGIIVDDAIVIAESVRSQVRAGCTPTVAAVEGTGVVALPVLASSATTIVAFVPLMCVEGIMGKLIYDLPVVVIAAVVASAVEAFVILPAHLREWGSAVGGQRSNTWRTRARLAMDEWIDRAIERVYRPCLRWSLNGRVIVLGVAVAMVLVSVGLVFGGRAPFVLFPKIDANRLRVRVQFPHGTPTDVSAAAVARIERAILALNDEPALKPAAEGDLVENVYAVVGEWSQFVPKRGSALCEVFVELMPAEKRKVDVAQVIEHWRRRIGEIPDAIAVTITRQQLGPTDKPLEIRLLGEDLDELTEAAAEVKDVLSSYAGVFNITEEPTAGKRELRVSLKPAAANLGLSVADLASQLRQGLYGGEAVRLQRGPDEVKVVVSYEEQDRRSLSAIEDLRIRTSGGTSIPFNEVAETRMVRGYSMIPRMDGLRRARVQADVDERYANAERIIQELAVSFLPDLEKKHAGVRVVIDGQRKRIDESLGSLVRASAVAGVVMLGLLATVLRSYAQPLIIMSAIPLGMVGAVLGHAVMGYSLTLMSVFGMVALAGIVVNDSLVLVDRINRNVALGQGVMEAVAAAGEMRFRAVVLTSVTTVAGLLPLLAERSSQAQSLIPMAISIAFGLMLATVLTLVVVPALYLAVNDGKRFVRWFRRGGPYPTPESVEAVEDDEALAVASSQGSLKGNQDD